MCMQMRRVNSEGHRNWRLGVVEKALRDAGLLDGQVDVERLDHLLAKVELQRHCKVLLVL